MIRKHVSFILLMLCLCVFGCDDSANLDELLTVAPDIIAPDTQDVVTDLTPEVWEKIRFVREFGVRFNENLLTTYPENDGIRASYERELKRAEGFKVLQEAFYNRYIDADGIPIIGNEITLDKYFIMARDILLMMTSKNPRLREPLRDKFYLVIVGGTVQYWLAERSDRSYTQLFPDFQYFFETTGKLLTKNTCQTGGLTLDYGPRTSSGLVRVWGWCVSQILGRYEDPFSLPRSGQPIITQPFSTFVHEVVHALERIMYDIDPTFEEKLLRAHKNSDEKGLWGTPTILPEWWAGATQKWFFHVHPEYTTDFTQRIFESTQDVIEYDPLAAELFLQWYPEISFAGIAENY